MALQKQLVPVSFGQGIDTKTDDKQQIQGTLQRAVNTVFDKLLLSKKRPGYDLINLIDESSSIIENSRILARFRDELNLLTDEKFYSYSPSRNILVDRGNLFNVTASSDSIVSNSYQHESVDSAIVETYRVYCWKNSSTGQIGYSVVDNTNNSIIVSDGILSASGNLPKIGVISNVVYIFYVGSTGDLKYKKFSILTPESLSSEQTAAADLGLTTPVYDIFYASNRIYIAYNSEPTSEVLKLFYVSQDGTLSSAVSIGSELGRVFLNVVVDSMNRVVLLYGTGAAVKYTIYNFNLTSQLLAPTVIETIDNANHGTLVETSSDQYTVIYEIYNLDDLSVSFIKKAEVDSSGAVGSASVLIRGLALASKAIFVSGEIYFLTLFISDLQATYFVINSNGKIAIKMAENNAGNYITDGSLTSFSQVSDNEFLVAHQVKTKLAVSGSQIFSVLGVNSATLTFNSEAPFISAQLGENLHLAGGILRMYDGKNVVEHGFHVYPEQITTTPVGLSTSDTTVTVEQLVAGDTGAKESQLIQFTPAINGPATAAISNNGTNWNFTSPALINRFGAGQYPIYLLYPSDDAAAIQNKINSTTYANVTVTGDYSVGFTITFNRPVSNLAQITGSAPALRGAGNAPVSLTISTITDGVVPAEERQQINFFAVPTAGTWTITIGANTTGSIAYNATNSTIKTAIEALPGITTVDVTGSYADGIVVRFINPTTPASLMSITSVLTHDDYGGSLADGSYGYAAVYSWTDNFGQVHRSAPSVVTNITLDAGTSTQGVTIKVPTLKLTDKENVLIEIYRTEQDGTIFYNIVSPEQPLFNDSSLDFIEFVDDVSDDDLITREPLYTTGGVLENIAAPNCTILTTSSERVAVAGIDRQPYTIRFSKIKGQFSPVEFTDTIERDIDPVGGPIRALAVLDEKYIIFTERAMFYISGQGPNNLGQQDDFTAPEQISTDIGCSDQRSVVVTPFGLMFKSSKGIYLLERSLQLSYIGAPVEDFNNLTITSAKVLANSNQVIFTTDTPTALTYNYETKKWGVYNNHNAISAETIGSDYYFLKSNEELFKQNRSKFSDGDSPITQSFETGWMTLAPLQGFQRVYKLLILGEYKSAHKLKISIAYDYKNAYTQSVLIDPNDFIDPSAYGDYSPYGDPDTVPYGGAGNLYQIRIDLTQQKCQSIKVKIEEFQDEAGEGSQFSAMTFQIGVKQGTNKLPVANKTGTE